MLLGRAKREIARLKRLLRAAIQGRWEELPKTMVARYAPPATASSQSPSITGSRASSALSRTQGPPAAVRRTGATGATPKGRRGSSRNRAGPRSAKSPISRSRASSRAGTDRRPGRQPTRSPDAAVTRQSSRRSASPTPGSGHASRDHSRDTGVLAAGSDVTSGAASTDETEKTELMGLIEAQRHQNTLLKQQMQSITAESMDLVSQLEKEETKTANVQAEVRRLKQAMQQLEAEASMRRIASQHQSELEMSLAQKEELMQQLAEQAAQTEAQLVAAKQENSELKLRLQVLNTQVDTQLRAQSIIDHKWSQANDGAKRQEYFQISPAPSVHTVARRSASKAAASTAPAAPTRFPTLGNMQHSSAQSAHTLPSPMSPAQPYPTERSTIDVAYAELTGNRQPLRHSASSSAMMESPSRRRQNTHIRPASSGSPPASSRRQLPQQQEQQGTQDSGTSSAYEQYIKKLYSSSEYSFSASAYPAEGAAMMFAQQAHPPAAAAPAPTTRATVSIPSSSTPALVPAPGMVSTPSYSFTSAPTTSSTASSAADPFAASIQRLSAVLERNRAPLSVSTAAPSTIATFPGYVLPVHTQAGSDSVAYAPSTQPAALVPVAASSSRDMTAYAGSRPQQSSIPATAHHAADNVVGTPAVSGASATKRRVKAASAYLQAPVEVSTSPKRSRGREPARAKVSASPEPAMSLASALASESATADSHSEIDVSTSFDTASGHHRSRRRSSSHRSHKSRRRHKSKHKRRHKSKNRRKHHHRSRSHRRSGSSSVAYSDAGSESSEDESDEISMSIDQAGAVPEHEPYVSRSPEEEKTDRHRHAAGGDRRTRHSNASRRSHNSQSKSKKPVVSQPTSNQLASKAYSNPRVSRNSASTKKDAKAAIKAARRMLEA